MSEIHTVLAECVAALWKYGAPENESLPDYGGIVDKAIEHVYREIPGLEKLSFSNTKVGRRCLDWPEAVAYLQYSAMAEIDGTTYSTYRITISGTEAYRLLHNERGLSKGDRKLLSSRFYQVVKKGRAAYS